MASGSGDAPEGRVRSGRAPLLALSMVAILAGVWLIGLRLDAPSAPSPSPSPEPTPTGAPETAVSEEPSHAPPGRLVYPSFEPGGPDDRPQRLWVLDLETGGIAEGPRIPTAEELVAVGPDRSWILVISDRGLRGGAAYLLRDLSPDTTPVLVATGDLLSVSNRADAVVTARTEPVHQARCPSSRFVVRRVALERGVARTWAWGRVGCGNLVAVTAVSDQVYVSIVRDGMPETAAVSGGRLATFFPRVLLLSAGPDGSWLTVDVGSGVMRSLGVWPRTPTGRLAWSRGPSTRRPLVTAGRLFAERVVAWSRDGRAVAVGGIVGGDRSMWLVDVVEGTITPLLPANSVPLRSAFSGASFDGSGAVYVGSPGAIHVGTPAGLALVAMAPDAPSPAGPVAWLP